MHTRIRQIIATAAEAIYIAEAACARNEVNHHGCQPDSALQDVRGIELHAQITWGGDFDEASAATMEDL